MVETSCALNFTTQMATSWLASTHALTCKHARTHTHTHTHTHSYIGLRQRPPPPLPRNPKRARAPSRCLHAVSTSNTPPPPRPPACFTLTALPHPLPLRPTLSPPHPQAQRALKPLPLNPNHPPAASVPPLLPQLRPSVPTLPQPAAIVCKLRTLTPVMWTAHPSQITWQASPNPRPFPLLIHPPPLQPCGPSHPQCHNGARRRQQQHSSSGPFQPQCQNGARRRQQQHSSSNSSSDIRMRSNSGINSSRSRCKSQPFSTNPQEQHSQYHHLLIIL